VGLGDQGLIACGTEVQNCRKTSDELNQKVIKSMQEVLQLQR